LEFTFEETYPTCPDAEELLPKTETFFFFTAIAPFALLDAAADDDCP